MMQKADLYPTAPTPSPFSPAPPSQLPRVSACVVAAPPAQVVTSLREWAAAPGAKDEETWHQTKVPKLRSNSSNSILADSYHFFFIELGPVCYSLNYIWSSSYKNFWTFQTASAKLLFALLGICCPLLSVNIPSPVEFGWKIRWFWHLGAFMESNCGLRPLQKLLGFQKGNRWTQCCRSCRFARSRSGSVDFNGTNISVMSMSGKKPNAKKNCKGSCWPYEISTSPPDGWKSAMICANLSKGLLWNGNSLFNLWILKHPEHFQPSL